MGLQLAITDKASQWFHRELDLPAEGAGIRFFGKAYGKTQVHDGFSVGMTRDDHPDQPIMAVKKDGVTYFVNPTDAWFFENLVMTVDYDAHLDEPKYEFKEEPQFSSQVRR